MEPTPHDTEGANRGGQHGRTRGPEGANRTRGVDWRPSLLLSLGLALQHVLVQCALPVLLLGILQCHMRVPWSQGEWAQHLATLLFSSAASTLLHTWIGTCMPLVQAPSLEFLGPAVVLLSTNAGNTGDCRKAEAEGCGDQSRAMRELQGMVLVAGLLQVCVGVCGLGGVCVLRCGPLVLAPVVCVLGLSMYRDAALLCSDHWGAAALAVLLMVILSQHVRSLPIPAFLGMLSVLLPGVIVWCVFGALATTGHVRLHTLSELLPDLHVQNDNNNTNTATLLLDEPDTHFLNATLLLDDSVTHFLNASHTVWENSSSGLDLASSGMSISLPWVSLPHTGVWRPLVSVRAAAAGAVAVLASCSSSIAVYCLSSRIMGAPLPPAHTCNRGLFTEGLGTLAAALLGSPLGVASSVANACTIQLSQCGSRKTVQMAAILGMLLGLSPRLTAAFLSAIPLAVYGAILWVTYAVSTGTGVTYFQFGHIDSGRNIFNTGFTIFMALALPHWFRLQPDALLTGSLSGDVLMLSVMASPVLLIFSLAFLLENTVSGTLPERGLTRAEGARGKTVVVMADSRQYCCQETAAMFEPPRVVRRLQTLPYLRVVPFYACRTPEGPREEDATPTYEMANLLTV